MANTYDFGALRFVFRGAYVSTTAYTFNDVVKYNGALYVYISKTNTTGSTPADATPWALMLSAGSPFTAGARAARPAAGTAGAVYLVAGDATAANNGILFFDTGTAWTTVGSNSRLVRLYADAAADVPLQVTGATTQTADLAQFNNAAGTSLARVTARGVYVAPSNPKRTLTYNAGGQLTTVTVTDAAGSTTYQTQTLSYDSNSNLTQVVTVADGRTVTQTLTYDASNNLTTVTEVVS